MKINTKYRIVLLALFAVLTSTNATAQANFTIVASGDNCIALSGTSTLDDWTMTTFTFSGNAVFTTEPGYYITDLKALHFSLPVTTLKSGKKALDKKAYKALKAKKFKTITYQLISAKVVGEQDYKYVVATVGMLTIGGVTKRVAITMNCTPNKNFSITCEGEFVVKMTDYNLDPPHFFDGRMSTSESVTIDFSMRFER